MAEQDPSASTADQIKGSRTGNINQIYNNPGNDPGPKIAELWKKYPGQVIPPVALLGEGPGAAGRIADR